MPTPKEFYEGESRRRFYDKTTGSRTKKGHKNTKEDVDFYLFSYTAFLDLLKRGDFNCMELLFVPEDKIIIDSPEFQELRRIRDSLLVNDISAFLGFIKKEYRRYGVNIYHYKAQEDFCNFLEQYKNHTRLTEIWGDLKEYGKDKEHILFTTSETGHHNRVPSIKIAQRLFQDTVKVEYVRSVIKDRLEKYGHRQKNMAKDGVEFKGLYHALRLIYEANDLYDHGRFYIPFDKKRHEILKSIKDSTANQDEIFDLIDTELDKLQKRENEVVSNRSSVESIVDKLLFKIRGQKELEYVTGKIV